LIDITINDVIRVSLIAAHASGVEIASQKVPIPSSS